MIADFDALADITEAAAAMLDGLRDDLVALADFRNPGPIAGPEYARIDQVTKLVGELKATTWLLRREGKR